MGGEACDGWPTRQEEDLRRAGLVRDGDRLPKRPRGDSRFATMAFDGSLRLRLEPEEAAATRSTAQPPYTSELLKDTQG
jgi:hypothetical protein